MNRFSQYKKGMGIGGWLTNYKRFNVLQPSQYHILTVGDMEHFHTYITEEDIIRIKGLGMDHIRLGFDQIVLEEQKGVYREEILKIIDEFIGWCEKQNLGIVLNLHKAVGNYCDIKEDTELLDDESLQDRFIALWLMLARRYADKPQIAFEPLNELRDVDPVKWNRLWLRLLSEIRKVNPDRVVIIGGTCWNSCRKLEELTVVDDPNVVYTWHFYAPHEFTHQQSVLNADAILYNRKLLYPCDDIERYNEYHYCHGREAAYHAPINKDTLRSLTKPAFDFQKAHPDQIVWCGEFGTIRHADRTSRENWMRDVISLLKENDMPYCVWNYLSTPNDGNRFSLVDDDTREILSDELLRIIQGNV